MAQCKECGSKNIDGLDSDILNRLTSIETKLGTQPTEQIAEHLKTCTNCQNVISEIVSKKFDVEEKEDEDDEEEE
jgi:predicted anti-sigma-YlaC factor YlaD